MEHEYSMDILLSGTECPCQNSTNTLLHSGFANVMASVENDTELSADERELLLLLLHEDDTPSAATPPANDVVASEEATVASVRKINPRRNRKRRKHEVDALRVQLRELSEKLERLQALANDAESVRSTASHALVATHVALPDAQSSSDKERDGDSQWIVITSSKQRVPSAWETLAWTQREHARAAVSENWQLRTAYEGQLQTLQQLETLYHTMTRPHETEALDQRLGVLWRQDLLTRTAQLSKRARTDPFDADTAVFASLGRDFDAQYAKAEAILASAGLAGVERNLKRLLVLKRSENGIYFLENLHSRLYARDVFENDRRAWSRLSNPDLNSHHEAYEVGARSSIMMMITYAVVADVTGIYRYFLALQVRETTQDVLCRKIVNTIRLVNADATLIRRTALKRYIEPHRVVVVWDTALEITGSVSMRLRERGWKVMRRPRELPLNYDGGPISIEQTCVRITPEQWTTYDVDDIAPGSLAHTVVGSYSQHLRQMHIYTMDLLASDFEEMAVRTKYFAKPPCGKQGSDSAGDSCPHHQQQHWRPGECHRPPPAHMVQLVEEL